MILVFVIDNSPSMLEPSTHESDEACHVTTSTSTTTISSNSSSTSAENHSTSPLHTNISKLDLAKMMTEQIVKLMDKRVYEHNLRLQSSDLNRLPFKECHNLGFGYASNDRYLLLSTGCPPDVEEERDICEAGGRLLVGFGCNSSERKLNQGYSSLGSFVHQNQPNLYQQQKQQRSEFDRQLKQLKAVSLNSSSQGTSDKSVFPNEAGGAKGLNIALSAGLQLLSRNRLLCPYTENYGMGRLPSNVNVVPKAGGKFHTASNALQPACMIILTDGESFIKPPQEGGGTLQLQFGNIPLKEFYREPFRWDQRVFCLGIGATASKLHSSLKALCEVTGGCHMALKSARDVLTTAMAVVGMISPPLPSLWPIENPLLPSESLGSILSDALNQTKLTNTGEIFVNGGPVVCFQTVGEHKTILCRALILFAPLSKSQYAPIENADHNAQPCALPIWPIPESYWPSIKNQNLPPRNAQPILCLTRNYTKKDWNTFNPLKVMKMLNHLDKIMLSNASFRSQLGINRLLQRDVYLCQWISRDGNLKPNCAFEDDFQEQYFPVFVKDAGSVKMLAGGENVLNIGILHIPARNSCISSSVTLLPPEPHILLPILIRSAEAEHRYLKKAATNSEQSSNVLNTANSVIFDENFRSDMGSYFCRIPPYYHPILKRCLKSSLPSSAHSILPSDSEIPQYLSQSVHLRIKAAEQSAKEYDDKNLRREEEYKKCISWNSSTVASSKIRYGHYDPLTSLDTYLSMLRSLPPPPKNEVEKSEIENGVSEISQGNDTNLPRVFDCLGMLPKRSLLAFYESRRRWIFGGEGVSTKGLSVEGVKSSSSCHTYPNKPNLDDEPLLSLAGLGASRINEAPIGRMSDFKERILFSRQPIVGIGSIDTCVSPVTIRPDGSPSLSVRDDELNSSFFDPRTGEMLDNNQARIRSAFMINFGNPFKNTTGDSIVPEAYYSQRPPRKHHTPEPTFSPPHGE